VLKKPSCALFLNSVRISLAVSRIEWNRFDQFLLASSQEGDQNNNNNDNNNIRTITPIIAKAIITIITTSITTASIITTSIMSTKLY
jgi:hypothetical protein